MSNGLPSNDPPADYLSIRITVDHEKLSLLQEKVFHDVPSYIIYPHVGKVTEKPHFHVLVPDGTPNTAARLRARINKHIGRGNGTFAIQVKGNGILLGLQYCSHENTDPTLGGSFSQQWVDDAPPWVEYQTTLSDYVETDEIEPGKKYHSREFTYRSVVKVALAFRRKKGIASVKLSDTLAAMCKDGWRPNIAIIRGGLPASLFDDFAAQCTGGDAYSANRFDMMRNVENWRVSIH